MVHRCHGSIRFWYNNKYTTNLLCSVSLYLYLYSTHIISFILNIKYARGDSNTVFSKYVSLNITNSLQ